MYIYKLNDSYGDERYVIFNKAPVVINDFFKDTDFYNELNYVLDNEVYRKDIILKLNERFPEYEFSVDEYKKVYEIAEKDLNVKEYLDEIHESLKIYGYVYKNKPLVIGSIIGYWLSLYDIKPDLFYVDNEFDAIVREEFPNFNDDFSEFYTENFIIYDTRKENVAYDFLFTIKK